MRTIIEENGGNGQVVKEHIHANYRKGILWWKDERVAEWKDGSFVFKGAALTWKAKFDKYMGSE